MRRVYPARYLTRYHYDKISYMESKIWVLHAQPPRPVLCMSTGRRRQRGVQYLNLHMIQHHCVSFSRPPHPPRYGVAEPSKGVSFPGIWRAVFLRWAGSFLLARGGFCPSWVVFFCGCGWCLLFGALGPLGASACPGLSPFLLAVVCGALGLVPTEVFFSSSF